MSDAPGTERPLLSSLARSAAALGAVAAAGTLRRAATTFFGYFLVAGLLTTSLFFLTSAAHHALADALGSIFASLIVGCLFLIAGLAIALALQLRRR